MPDQVHRLSRRDARRIALRAQLLDSPRPTDLFDVVRRLTVLQVDPIKAVAPSADLVLWSRLGASYDPQELSDAVDEQALIELHGRLRPAEDLVLFRAEMAQWPGPGELSEWEQEQLAWLEANH
ncbi:MAG: winged helix-turn-helix domain-containing protein, partial [Nocardioides sp.]|nr:winged helix-turn-helix domain-containing protein [Nocardioides sp.]